MIFRKLFSVILIINLSIIFCCFFKKSLAKDEDDFSLEKFCPSFTENLDAQCQKLGVNECREYLEKCEKFYQKQSEIFENEIQKLEKKKKTLQNEIYFLDTKIKNLAYQIRKNNLIIKDLNLQLKDTQEGIKKTTAEINKVKENLMAILQLRYEQDQKSVLEILVLEEKLSKFFDNLVALEKLNAATQQFLRNLQDLKNQLQKQKDSMLEEKERLERTLVLVNLQKEESESVKAIKKNLLSQTKGQEDLYQKYLQRAKQKAQQIRKKIFELAQVPQAEALTLEQAYNLAKEVEKITGVRASLLLGLLKVESDIGKNVGQCNCKGKTFCRHPEIHWKEIMKKRQWPYFLQITKELGLDPQTTPVSCAINGGKVQWGGAMGPAQFMPETWLKLGYKKRVEEITGMKPANPWRVRDAFLAAGLYLADWGAASQKKWDEIGAVTAYLCGTNKMTRKCRISGGKSYVYNVMRYAEKFQQYVEEGIFD